MSRTIRHYDLDNNGHGGRMYELKGRGNKSSRKTKGMKKKSI